MKNWVIIVITYAILIISLVLVVRENSTLEKKWKDAVANNKNYDKLNSSTDNRNTAFQMTIEQLNVSKDSINRELNSLRKQQKVKNKELKSVQYVTSTFVKTDTVVFNDTLFKDHVIDLDTTLNDDWYTANVKLKYPASIILSPSFKSEKSVIVSSKKETVNPPKKLWILRLFQKKHRVLHIDVIEKNPYVTDEISKYVEIIK